MISLGQSLVLLASCVALTQAFVAPKKVAYSSAVERQTTVVFMAPRFDSTTKRWSPTKPEEEASAGYGITKTLLLRGPKPFFHRLLQADDYDQAVLKFMAGDGVSRDEAQGNMDAYLENPNDWAYQRFEDQKNGVKRDYVTIDEKQLALTLTWATVVFATIGRSIFSISTGEKFWSFLPWMQ